MLRPHVVLFLLAWGPAAAGFGSPQGAGSPPGASGLTLDQAIQYAGEHYPAVRVALEQAHASAAGVDLARSAYLPRLDALWQSNRGTANNVFGQVLPQGVIPALTGPVLPTESSGSVWSSATGALLSWEPFDFGSRRAAVAGAQAGLARARAAEILTRLEVQNAVAEAFLTVLAAERTVVAARADLDRRNVLLRTVQALVDNQLRPGVDASRARAEQAAARTRVIQSEEALAIAGASLSRAMGLTSPVTIAGDRLLDHVPPGDLPPVPAVEHPLARERQAEVGQARSAEVVLARADRPRIFLESSVFARGSGASPDGTLAGTAAGLRPGRANWAAGVQFVLPNLFDFAALGARKAAASASARASVASYDEAVLAVTAGQRAASARVRGAREVAGNTPVQLAAARETETRARARYDAGLANLVEVADAQGLLAQSEVQDEIARVEVWRALLAAAAAQGDLAPFVDLVRQ